MTYITEQREDKDCAVAALAMFLGRDYDQVRSLVTRSLKDGGLFLNEIQALARFFGIKLRKGFGRPSRKCILVIKDPGAVSHHAVVFDGVRAIDPWPYNYYTTEQNLRYTQFYLY